MLLNQTENLKYCNEALSLKKEIEVNFLDLGEHLFNIKTNNLFLPQWDSFTEFCMELKMTQRNVDRLIQVYNVFILQYNFSKKEISDAGVSLLTDVLPVVKTRKQAEKWLSKIEVLSRQDLRKELTEFKTGVDMIKCKHQDFYTINICRDCGERWKNE